MRDQLYFEGELYCDWRIFTRGCVDQDFFTNVAIVNSSVQILILIVSFSLLFYRLLIKKESQTLVNISLEIWTATQIFYALSYLLSIFSKIYIVNEIIWSFTYPLAIFSSLVYLNALIKATPKFGLDQGFVPTDQTRRVGLIFLSLALFISHILIFAFVGYFEYKNDSRTLFVLYKIGMGLMSFTFSLVAVLVCVYGFNFIKVVGKVIEEDEKTKADIDSMEHVALKLAFEKVKKILRSLLIICMFYTTIALLFGFYNNFFTNTTLSKAFCILNCILTFFNIPFVLLLVFVDIQKVREIKKHSSKESSRIKMPTTKEMEHTNDFMQSISAHD